MALLERPPRSDAGLDPRDRRRRVRPTRPSYRRPADRRGVRALMIALLMACATLATLDVQGDTVTPGAGASAPSARSSGRSRPRPPRRSARSSRSPAGSAPRTPCAARWTTLEAENSALREQVAGTDFDRNRLAEYDGLTAAAEAAGYALVPTRVVGIGPAQSFSRTVTIDAGARAGVAPDMTVVNNDGLVGRVLRVTETTATVLLVLDGDSVVGGRIGSSLEAGFLRGRGVLGNDGRLDLELVDDTVIPAKGDVVVTWGSEDGAPYVAGIPVGKVTEVYTNLRETTQRAVIEPFVDFSSLDLVGVVVPSGTRSDRAVVEADGSIQ